MTLKKSLTGDVLWATVANDAANIAWWRVGKYQNKRHALKKHVLLHILLYKGDKNVQKVPKNAIFYPKKVIFPKKNCDITGVFHFQNVWYIRGFLGVLLNKRSGRTPFVALTGVCDIIGVDINGVRLYDMAVSDEV